MKRTNASLLFFLACLASCVPARPPSLALSPPPSLALSRPPLAIEGMNEQPPVRVTVELPATEDPASRDRKGAEELAKALQQTGQFEVATAVSSSSRVFLSRPSPQPDPEVNQVQGILKELGYDPGSVDGRMGEKTRAALQQFQRDRNLPVTGQLDAATKAALQQAPTRAPTEPRASTSDFSRGGTEHDRASRPRATAEQQLATRAPTTNRAPTTEDYVVRTSTTPDGDKVRMEVSVWDMRLGKLVNWTVVEGRPDAIDEKMICDSPSGAPLSSVDKALCDTVRQVRLGFYQFKQQVVAANPWYD